MASNKPLPECDRGTRVPHEPRMCGDKKCRDLVGSGQCPKMQEKKKKSSVKTVIKKCIKCSGLFNVASAQQRCPECDAKTLVSMRQESIGNTDALPCGDPFRAAEFKIHDWDGTRAIQVRYYCTHGHRTEWRYTGRAPDPSEFTTYR